MDPILPLETYWKLVVGLKLLHLPDPRCSFFNRSIVFQMFGFDSLNIEFSSRHEAWEAPDRDSSIAKRLPRPQTWHAASLLQGPFPQTDEAPPHPGVTRVMSCQLMSCHLCPTVCSCTRLKSSSHVAVIRLSHCIIKESCHHTGEDSHTLAPAVHPSPRMKPTCFCVSMETAWLSPQLDLWQIVTLSSCCGEHSVIFSHVHCYRPHYLLPSIQQLLWQMWPEHEPGPVLSLEFSPEWQKHHPRWELQAQQVPHH